MEVTAPQQRLYSVREFADEISVSPNTIRDWVRTGQLKALRLGPKLIRIPATEIDRIATPAAPWADELPED